MPPAKGYLFEARTGATKPRLNYIAVYHKIKELAPKFLQLLREKMLSMILGFPGSHPTRGAPASSPT